MFFFCEKFFCRSNRRRKKRMLRNYDDVFRETFFCVDRFIFQKDRCKAIFLHRPCIAVALQNGYRFALQLHCNRNAKGDAKPMQNHLSLHCNCNATAMQWQCKTDANQQCNCIAKMTQKITPDGAFSEGFLTRNRAPGRGVFRAEHWLRPWEKPR